MTDPYSSLPPMPRLDLTMEQDFKLRRMQELMKNCPREQLVEVFMEVQKHNFILTNNLQHMLSAWLHSPPPTTPEEPPKYGISSGNNS
jgi:hypothetical protein